MSLAREYLPGTITLQAKLSDSIKLSSSLLEHLVLPAKVSISPYLIIFSGDNIASMFTVFRVCLKIPKW